MDGFPIFISTKQVSAGEVSAAFQGSQDRLWWEVIAKAQNG